MKRIIAVITLVALVVCSLVGCGAKSAYENEEWVFSGIGDVTIKPDLDEYRLEQLYEEFGTTDIAVIEASMKEVFIEEKQFDKCYLTFTGNLVKHYDFVMDREDATYAVYKTSENEGFFSVYTELDVADGNPDPNTNPVFYYNPETNVFTVVESSMGFFVSVEYRVK